MKQITQEQIEQTAIDFNKDTVQAFFIEIQNTLELSLETVLELIALYEKELKLQQQHINTIIKYTQAIIDNDKAENSHKELTEEEIKELQTLQLHSE